eukprot:TRINITY_DN18133_c0_g1_i1.p1 TRINITY_DN18133_c0_g1~~TRINITY_DN18133_c0_g1_i1.p1  ORF type:complete len:185 (-),score=27.63 TRINITY_DN18133_c0_g1_i1:169-669(-)
MPRWLRKKRERREKNARSNCSHDDEADAPRKPIHNTWPMPFHCFRCDEVQNDRHWYEWQTSSGTVTVCIDCHGYLSCMAAEARKKRKVMEAEAAGVPVVVRSSPAFKTDGGDASDLPSWYTPVASPSGGSASASGSGAAARPTAQLKSPGNHLPAAQLLRGRPTSK